MKKMLILTAALLTGGLALPAAAQSHRGYKSPSITVFISGHLSCGTPIYSKRVRHGKHYRNERLSKHELQRYLATQRRHAVQRDLRNRHARSKHSHRSHSRYTNYSRRR